MSGTRNEGATTFDLAEGIAVLERTPSVLRTLLADLPGAWTTVNEGADTWSAFDVVGHLIDGEETDWIPRARIILARDHSRRFEPFDRTRHFALNRGRTLEQLLDRFAELRTENLGVLCGFAIGSRELELTGVHPEFGVVTLRQLLATWVAHDLGHLVQIARVMARRYRSDAGPWRAYLSVIR